MVFYSVVDDDRNVKMIVKCEAFLSCRLVSCVVAYWNSSVVVWGQFTVVGVSQDGCRGQIIQVQIISIVMIDEKLHFVSFSPTQFFSTSDKVRGLVERVFVCTINQLSSLILRFAIVIWIVAVAALAPAKVE